MGLARLRNCSSSNKISQRFSFFFGRSISSLFVPKQKIALSFFPNQAFKELGRRFPDQTWIYAYLIAFFGTGEMARALLQEDVLKDIRVFARIVCIPNSKEENPPKKIQLCRKKGSNKSSGKSSPRRTQGVFFQKLNRTCILGSRLRQMTRSKAVSNVLKRISLNPRRPVLKILALCLRILIFPHVFVYSSVRAGLVVVVVWCFCLCLCFCLCVGGGCGFSRSKEPSKRHYQRQLRPHKQRHTTDKPSITKLRCYQTRWQCRRIFLVYYKPIFLGCVEEQTVASVRVANPRFDFNGRVGQCRESQTMSLGESPDPSCRQLNHSSSSLETHRKVCRNPKNKKTHYFF